MSRDTQPRYMVRKLSYLIPFNKIISGARSRNRTGTEFNLRRILSPVCLPISPPGPMSIQTVGIIYDRLVKFSKNYCFWKKMGIIKVLIIALLAWVAFKIYSGLKLRSKRANDLRLNKKIVPCSFCKTHIPTASAIKIGNKYFCSLDHSKNA